jgi:putative SOS response-associated peptidase YedK
MANPSPFAVSRMLRDWIEEDGTTSYSFTQLTMNADDHPLMKRFHRTDDEKRSLIIFPKDARED